MENTQLPVDILHWILAMLPIVALLVLLLPLGWRAPEAGPVGMFVAAAVALFFLRTPWETLAVAGAKGVWDSVLRRDGSRGRVKGDRVIYNTVGRHESQRGRQPLRPHETAIVGSRRTRGANLHPRPRRRAR